MPDLKAGIRGALKDESLGRAVLKATNHSLSVRAAVINELPDWESARDAARRVRQFALDHFEELKETFIANFPRSGGVVHLVKDGAEARRLVIDILAQRGLNRGVKSKSMVAEEIGLGTALSDAGIDAVESDLGEFIVQLLGQPPSHITAPALHLSREAIGRLFQEKLNIPFTSEPAELTAAARRFMRERFLTAQFAISGANFLVAETGQLVVVENEGNARLGLSLPPVVVVITGIEKFIAELKHLSPLLKLLARSATGQRITNYVSLIGAGGGGWGRSQELHLVLVDNGRSEALKDHAMREMMLCIRCGACLNVCPVYRSIGGHAYGSVYPGPMGAVLSNLIGEEREKMGELPHLSTLCGACRDICPVKIDIPRMLLELRARGTQSFKHRVLAEVWGWTMRSTKRLEVVSTAARFAADWLPDSLLPPIKPAPSSFREIWRGRADDTQITVPGDND